MAATLFSAFVTCLSSLFIGQAALRLAGAREWSWMAPAVGISVVMLIAVPAAQVPGRCATMAVVVGLLTIAAVAWCLREPAHRPPLSGLLAIAPILLLVLLPFLAAGREGILGTSMDNDMAAHMLIVEGYLSQAVADVSPIVPEYPVGPHAMVALISEGFGIRVDQAFTGWSMALVLLNGWTAVALVRRSSLLKQALVATVVGMPFLVAAYYGEGSFKEVVQAGLVLAFALFFAGYGPSLGRGKWVPPALLVAGIISVYSVPGLTWPAMIVGLWLVGNLGLRLRRQGTKGLKAALVAELPSLGIAAAVLAAVLLPQVERISDFISVNFGNNGIVVPKEVLGNLVGPLPGWEAFGVWSNPDFRLPEPPGSTGWIWTAFVVALCLFGIVWTVRRGRWMLPATAAGAMLIWAYSIDSQSPYVVAKALVIASPLLLILAVLPLVEQIPDRPLRERSSIFRRGPGRPFTWGVAVLLVLVLFLRVGISNERALRASPVGPTDRVEQLRELRPLMNGQPTLFFGDDDFVKWELAGVPVEPLVFGGGESTELRPGKGWSRGMALDFDLVDAATLNSYRWFVTTRDAAGSAPPSQLRLVRATPSFSLWRRVGEVDHRSTLAEGPVSGSDLDCRTPEGRAVLHGGGVAAVRAKPVVAKGSLLPPGGTASVQLPLGPGSWELESSYLSRLPIEVTAPGLRTTLPPGLDRPGPRWPIGRIAVRKGQPTVLAFEVGDTALAPNVVVADLGTVVATRATPVRVIPVREACGRYVDWYRPADQRGR